MTLSADEKARFRSYVPLSLATDDDADTRSLALGSWEAAALEFLRSFRAGLLTNPSSFSVPEYSESWGQNIASLDKLILELEGLVSADSGGLGFGTGRMVRSGRGPISGYR